MRSVIQRVTHASVTIQDTTVGAIGPGLVILLGIGRDDGETEARWLAEKVANLRVFDNEAGQFDRSLLDVGGQALVISQFTLYGDARRGRRPSFSAAARPETAEPLVERFCADLAELGVPVETGRFGAYMQVEIHNDGPVTIWLDTEISRRGNVKA